MDIENLDLDLAERREIERAVSIYGVLTPTMRHWLDRLQITRLIETSDDDVIRVWKALSSRNLVYLFICERDTSMAIASLTPHGRYVVSRWEQREKLLRNRLVTGLF